MKILGIIPARKGSKRIPNKNIKELNGIPLIAWTILEAFKSSYISDLIVSTDSSEILKVAHEYGVKDDGLLRSDNLALDNTSTIDTVIYEINKRNILEKGFTHIMILQPTSPFRSSYDIDRAAKLLLDKSADSIISVTECEHPPEWSNPVDDSLLMNMHYQSIDSRKNSQQLKKSFRINGAIYLINIKKLIECKELMFKDKTFAYIMGKNKSIDIDDDFDWMLAENNIKFSKVSL